MHRSRSSSASPQIGRHRVVADSPDNVVVQHAVSPSPPRSAARRPRAPSTPRDGPRAGPRRQRARSWPRLENATGTLAEHSQRRARPRLRQDDLEVRVREFVGAPDLRRRRSTTITINKPRHQSHSRLAPHSWPGFPSWMHATRWAAAPSLAGGDSRVVGPALFVCAAGCSLR